MTQLTDKLDQLADLLDSTDKIQCEDELADYFRKASAEIKRLEQARGK